MNEMDSRTRALLGDAGILKLKQSTVAVTGLGGVGGYAAEALARSGVGTLYLYDNDAFSPSNLNRQIGATVATIGRLKTEVMAERIKQINPEINVICHTEFITPETDFPFDRVDFIIDAVDNVTAKLFLALGAQESKTPIISIMGTGNKLDPSRLQIGDVFKTRECPLCRVMRYECKKRAIKRLPCVWSDERPKKSSVAEDGRSVPSSTVFVPAAAGMLAASYAVQELIK